MATKRCATERERYSFFQFLSKPLEHLLARFSTFFEASKEQPIHPTQSLLPILIPAMAIPKTTPFKAYDMRRRQLHTIGGSGGKPAPRKTTIHRIVRSDWTAPKVTKPARRSARKSAKKATKAASLTAASILRCDEEETTCQHCGLSADDPKCGTKCYTAFKKANDADKLIDIKGPGKLGHGAFTKPGVTLKKGQWLGEYVGQLVPLDIPTTSLYRFEIPSVCAIDAEPCGNWTRFINSSCISNLNAWTDTIGKRHVVYFQASKDIGPEEELTFNYGKSYFGPAGFKCGCSAMKRLHMPGEAKAKAKVKPKKKGA